MGALPVGRHFFRSHDGYEAARHGTVWNQRVPARYPEVIVAAMSHLATGIQLADENLGQRPARFASDEAMVKLDRVRAEYDPDGLFNSWMGRI
ncbi:MAG: hypothetical protein QOG23_5056 [Blastocatellia bacterium]|nr:hypothetical protein [Blastocatellia bacterium]